MLNEYKKLKKDYEELEKKYDKLNRRFHSVMKMNDRVFKFFFNKDIKASKVAKRFNTILKQGDKQSKHWLIENEKNEELLIEQSKLASMGEMIENITHQMKQPLSLITTSSTALELKKEMDMLSNDEFLKYTSKITEATEYLSETINNFKDFFKNNKIKQNFLLSDVIMKSKKLLEAKFKGQNIKISCELSDINIYGIENDLIQVIINLLSNSIDAFNDTNDTNDTNDEKYIFIVLKTQDDTVIIQFLDTAGGILKDIINKVFNAHFTTKNETKGSGIGLYMTKTIIENNFNGTISVENKEFHYLDNDYTGTKFIIKIPNKILEQ